MSRSGRAARKARLIASGKWQDAAGWTPGAVLDRQAAADTDAADAARRERILAERDAWIAARGLQAWQAELVRRRGERNMRLRDRRRAGYATARVTASHESGTNAR